MFVTPSIQTRRLKSVNWPQQHVLPPCVEKTQTRTSYDAVSSRLVSSQPRTPPVTAAEPVGPPPG